MMFGQSSVRSIHLSSLSFPPKAPTSPYAPTICSWEMEGGIQEQGLMRDRGNLLRKGRLSTSVSLPCMKCVPLKLIIRIRFCGQKSVSVASAVILNLITTDCFQCFSDIAFSEFHYWLISLVLQTWNCLKSFVCCFLDSENYVAFIQSSRLMVFSF